MTTIRTQSGLGVSGRIETRVHDVGDLASNADEDWDDLSKDEKLEVARTTDPVYENTCYNVTTDELHNYLVNNLDPTQTGGADNVDISYLSLGIGGSGGTSASDTDLNDRVFTDVVNDFTDNGNELVCSMLLDSTEANGFELDELGLFTGDPQDLNQADVFLVNHATFGSIDKDNSSTFTFKVTLNFDDV